MALTPEYLCAMEFLLIISSITNIHLLKKLVFGTVLVLCQKNRAMKTNNEESPDKNNSTEKNDNTRKDPDTWKTGDEEMTGAQRSYLSTLAEEAGEEIDTDLTKAEASKKIDELQHKTGRGLDH
jgi:hypothetical protein